MCPQITNACVAATAPHKIRDLIHTGIQPHLLKLLTEQDELAHTQLLRNAIGAVDTGEAIATMRSAALLPKLVDQVIAAEGKRMQNAYKAEQDHKSPAPVGGVASEEGEEQETTAERIAYVIPCPYAWAEHHQHSTKIAEGKILDAWEDHLAHAHANIAGTIEGIANESASYKPMGTSAKHPPKATDKA